MVVSWSVQGPKSKVSPLLLLFFVKNIISSSCLPDHDEAMEEEIKEAIARSLALSGFKFSLKPEQFSCLSASLLGESVVAVLPTAFGKSLIYQLFPQA